MADEKFRYVVTVTVKDSTHYNHCELRGPEAQLPDYLVLASRLIVSEESECFELRVDRHQYAVR